MSVVVVANIPSFITNVHKLTSTDIFFGLRVGMASNAATDEIVALFLQCFIFTNVMNTITRSQRTVESI